jgi:hypothetical protein
VYVIKCSRKGKILLYDERSFVDTDEPEAEEHSRAIDADATAGDGVWVFDMCTRQQHGAQHHTAGLPRSTGIVRVFSSKEVANAQAALVWRSVQANCPDREAPPNWAELVNESDEDDSDDGEEQQSAAENDSSSEGRGTAGAVSKSTGNKQSSTTTSSSGDDLVAAAADPDSFRTMTADGRACWKREQHFYIDPWTDELKNVSASTLAVEVVDAQLVG